VKFGRLIISLTLLAATFVIGASIDDYYAQRQFRENLKKVRVGMSEAEAIALLGKPSVRKLTDRPGGDMCFSAGSFHFNPSTKCVIILEMNPDGRVAAAYPKEIFAAYSH